MIARLREQHATQEPAVRPAQDGDQVIVDFTGELDGERVEEACGEGMTFTIGQGQMIEDFDKGVVGLGLEKSPLLMLSFPTITAQKNCKARRSSFPSKSQR